MNATTVAGDNSGGGERLAKAEPERETEADLLAARVDEVTVALLVHVGHHDEEGCTAV